MKQLVSRDVIISYARFDRGLDQVGSTPLGYRTFAIVGNRCNGFRWRKHQITQNDLVIGEQLDREAKIIHEMYCDDQFALGDTQEANPSLVPWENLSEGMKDSNRGQADHLPIKLRAIDLSLVEAMMQKQPLTFTEQQIQMLADMEHRRWMACKMLDRCT